MSRFWSKGRCVRDPDVVGLVVAVAIVASEGDNSVSPLAPSEGTPLVIPHK